MIKLLEYVWSAIKSLCAVVLKLFTAIWNVLSSLVTWIVGALYYVLDTVWDWVSEKVGSFFDTASDLASDAIEGNGFVVPPLAEHIAEVFEFPLAIECLGVLVLAFVTARLLRLAMVPVRAVLELL